MQQCIVALPFDNRGHLVSEIEEQGRKKKSCNSLESRRDSDVWCLKIGGQEPTVEQGEEERMP